GACHVVLLAPGSRPDERYDPKITTNPDLLKASDSLIAHVLIGEPVPTSPGHALIGRPKAGRGHLQQMVVGIAEVQARPPGRPAHPALDRDAIRRQAGLPGRKLVRRDREGDMQLALAAVRRNGSTRQLNRLMRAAAAKQQQHALAADVEATEPLVARDRG